MGTDSSRSSEQRPAQPAHLNSTRVPLKHAAVCLAKVMPCLVWTCCKIVSKCQTRACWFSCVCSCAPAPKPAALPRGKGLSVTGLQGARTDCRLPSSRHQGSLEPAGTGTRSPGPLVGPTHPPPQCSLGHKGAPSCPEPAPSMIGSSAQAPSPQTVRWVSLKQEARGRGDAPVRPLISRPRLQGRGPALRGWGPPAQAPVTPAPFSVQPTSAGLQKHSPTSPRSTCTPTGRPRRAAHSRPPLPPPTASVQTSVPRPRTRGASDLGRNWTRTGGAGETAPWGPPAPRRHVAAPVCCDRHRGRPPRRRHGHRPGRVPEAGCFRLPLAWGVGKGGGGRGSPTRPPFPVSTPVFPRGPRAPGHGTGRVLSRPAQPADLWGPARPPALGF